MWEEYCDMNTDKIYFDLINKGETECMKSHGFVFHCESTSSSCYFKRTYISATHGVKQSAFVFN